MLQRVGSGSFTASTTIDEFLIRPRPEQNLMQENLVQKPGRPCLRIVGLPDLECHTHFRIWRTREYSFPSCGWRAPFLPEVGTAASGCSRLRTIASSSCTPAFRP